MSLAEILWAIVGQKLEKSSELFLLVIDSFNTETQRRERENKESLRYFLQDGGGKTINMLFNHLATIILRIHKGRENYIHF